MANDQLELVIEFVVRGAFQTSSKVYAEQARITAEQEYSLIMQAFDIE